jgi:N-acetylneuraminic acid mutarotase
VVVAVEDALGNLIVDSTAAITLSPSSGSLSGTVSAAAVNGSATFGDLSIDLTGSYTLMATSPGLAPATSDGFTISGNADAGPVECYALDAGPGTWATLTSCPNEHAETAGVAVGGSLYVVGGGPGQTGIVDAYDPIANSWTSKAGMNVPRGDSGVAAESGIIYVAGGLNGSNASIADLDMYNTATNAWTAGAQMPGGPRYHFPAVAVNGIVYAIGGWQSAGQGVALNRVEAYNPGSNSWTTVSSMPTARGGQAAAYLNGLIYVAGGCNGTCSSALNTVEAYDPVANSWTTKQALNVGRTQTAAGVVDGILLVVGGDDTGGNSLSSIEAYDPTTNSWTLKAPRPTAGAWLAVGGIGGSLYTMGDSTGHLLDAFTPCATGP